MTAPADAGTEATGIDDRDEFVALVARHRRALYAHCVGILHSREQAEDALQEALLRAWRSRAGFACRSSALTWLYRIATNTCLDEMRRDGSRSHTRQAPRLVALDDGAPLPPGAGAAPGPEPDAVAEARETLERAVVAVVATLPPRQRAALILCEVVRFSAAETAVLLETSVAGVNSALQRARATLGGGRPDPGSAGGSRPAERALVDAYVDAVRHSDVPAVVALARADAAGGAARRTATI